MGQLSAMRAAPLRLIRSIFGRVPAQHTDPVQILGLGTACLTSSVLKQMGVKNKSLPFDWIFSSPEMVEHAIQDDFASFLSRDNIVSIPEERRPAPGLYKSENKHYRDNFGVGYMFVHHNPSEEVTDYEYFVRCVDRLRSALAAEAPTVFVMTRVVPHQPNEQHHRTYRRLAELLRPHALLCVEIFHDGGGAPHIREVEATNRLIISQFLTASTGLINGVNFPEAADFDALASHIRQATAKFFPYQSLR